MKYQTFEEWERDEAIKVFRGLFVAVMLCVVFYALLVLAFCAQANAEEIDLKAIAQIESSGNPWAHNKADDSRGLYQITPICLKEYNNFHPKAAFSMDDLWNTSISSVIADWYLNKRIPQMLRAYKKPVTVENIIVAYNSGISYVVKNKPLPQITKNYLKKYARLTK